MLPGKTSRCALVLVSSLAACAPRARPPAPCPPAPAADPATMQLVQGYASLLETSTRLLAQQREIAVTGLLAERGLVEASLLQARGELAALDQRVLKARRATLTAGGSDLERARIAVVLLDLDEGRRPSVELPRRIREGEPYRDLTEAVTVRDGKRLEVLRLEAQLAAMDRALGSMSAPTETVTLPAGGGRPIRPSL